MLWDGHPAKFSDVYDTYARAKGLLGEGSIGSVQKVLHRESGRHFACKTIKLNRVSKSSLNELRNEIKVLQALDHPNIIRPLETFFERDQIRLVMQLCAGGDLYERPYTERRAINVMKKVCHGIAYCHAHNVMHRDIKFENIMYETKDKDSDVKLIDFGLSTKYAVSEHLNDIVGTPYSIAPEVVSADVGYGPKADMWSIGVVAYMMLVGCVPFGGSTSDDMMAAICKGRFNTQRLARFTPAAQEFIANLLVVDPDRRWNAEDALQSRWLTDLVPDEQLSAEAAPRIIHSIERFRNYSKFKKMALMVVAHRSDSAAMMNMRDAFMAIDKQNTGYITLEELHDVLSEHMPHDADFERVKTLFEGMDQDHSGKVHYLEFLAATLEESELHRTDELLRAFDRIDSDNTGGISGQNLKQMLGNDADDDEINQLIADADLKQNGHIDKEEFLEMMRQRQERAKSTLRASGFLSSRGDGGLAAIPPIPPPDQEDSDTSLR